MLAVAGATSLSCFSYSVTLRLPAVSRASVEADASKQEEVIALVGAVAREFGFVSNPRFDEIRHSSEVGDEYDHRLVADYVQPASSSDRIIISVGLEKTTGDQTVLIRDLDSTGPTEKTQSIEDSLVRALSPRFPEGVIAIDRRTVGPDLGP